MRNRDIEQASRSHVNLFICKAAILSLIAMLATSCGISLGTLGAAKPKTGTIAIALTGGTSLSPSSFSITGSASGGKSFSVTTTKSNTEVTNLEPANWTISVAAKDAAAATIGRGNGSATVVAGETVATAIGVTPVVNLGGSFFPIAVWMQQPNKPVGSSSKTVAQGYKDIGVNTFAGLWLWPSEGWAYSGYSMEQANILKNAGMRVYAGNGLVPTDSNGNVWGSESGVDWNNSHPEFASTFIGYLLGDEPDMFGVDPDAWKAEGEALAAADPSRGIYANFSKDIGLDRRGAVASAKFVSPTTVCSADYYGITDPYAATNQHGVWTYGRAVVNTKKYAGSRPVWGFLEASGPWYEREITQGGAHQLYTKMPASLIKPIVWNMVVNGAAGIVYFCHDFYDSAPCDYAPLIEPGIPEAMKEANESVLEYAAAINSETVSGTTAKTNGPVGVTALTKRLDGVTYIFAMGEGNENNIYGASCVGTITVGSAAGSGTVTVNVLNEGRTLTMTNGVFSDPFGPYELHIYSF